jgi:hypothetical protein
MISQEPKRSVRLDLGHRRTYLRCNMLHRTRGTLAMVKRIVSLIGRFVEPAIQMLGELPPQALNRLSSPF